MHTSHCLDVVDLHAAGRSLRWLKRGWPGSSLEALLSAKGLSALALQAWGDPGSPVRRLLLEPRGHAAQSVALIAPASAGEAGRRRRAMLVFGPDGPRASDPLDAACAMTALAEFGELEADERRLAFDFPDGSYMAEAEPGENGYIAASVRVGGSPAYRPDAGASIAGDRRPLRFAGKHLYYVRDAGSEGLRLDAAAVPALEAAASRFLSGSFVSNASDVSDGFGGGEAEQERRFVWTEEAPGGEGALLSAVVGADGRMRRSPGGEAAGALLALLASEGRVRPGEWVALLGLSGGAVEARLPDPSEAPQALGEWELRVRAYVTGLGQFFVDPSDPLKDGFLLR